MVKSVLETTHGEALLVTEVTVGFLWDPGNPLPVSSSVRHDVLADLAVEFLVAELFHAVTSLVKTRIAAVTVNYSVLILTFGAKANFTISLEERLQLLDSSQTTPLISFSSHLSDPCNF